MKIDFDEKVCNLSGLPIKNEDEEVTLKYCAINALLSMNAESSSLSGMEKFLRYELAQRVNKGVCEVSQDEIDKLKDLIGKTFPTMVVGPAYQMLDAGAASEVSPTPDEPKNDKKNKKK